MQAIANYAKLHHSTVSKIIKTADENPRIKTWPQIFQASVLLLVSIAFRKSPTAYLSAEAIQVTPLIRRVLPCFSASATLMTSSM